MYEDVESGQVLGYAWQLAPEYIPWEVLSLCNNIIIPLFVQWYNRYWALTKIPFFLLCY